MARQHPERQWQLYAAAAATIGQMLSLYPDYSDSKTIENPDEVVQKALWTGLLADLLRLTDEKNRQTGDMFEDFASALGALKTASISDTSFADQVRTYRARLYYRYGVALDRASKYPEAYQAFQQSQNMFAEQGGALVPEVEAARIQSYLALKHYDWFESLKYRLQNHL